MKKIIIAGASAVLAAMPVVGAFAATSSSFTDTLNVNVKGGCTVSNSLEPTAGTYTKSDRTFDGDIAAGNVGYLNASESGTPSTTKGTVSVTCNTGSEDTTVWTVSVDVTDLAFNSNTIAGGDAVSGDNSAWAIQSNATGTTASNPFAAYKAAADGPFLTAQAKETVTFNPSYRVYVKAGQAPGVYTGSAKYTIELPQQP
jgi:hypothetical protein